MYTPVKEKDTDEKSQDFLVVADQADPVNVEPIDEEDVKLKCFYTCSRSEKQHIIFFNLHGRANIGFFSKK